MSSSALNDFWPLVARCFVAKASPIDDRFELSILIWPVSVDRLPLGVVPVKHLGPLFGGAILTPVLRADDAFTTLKRCGNPIVINPDSEWCVWRVDFVSRQYWMDSWVQ